MKAKFETLTGTSMTAEIEISDTPVTILANLYKEDPENAKMFFNNQAAIDQILDGTIEEDKSTFSLLTSDGEIVMAKWKEPLCNQKEVKEKLAQIEAEGQIPTFTVAVKQFVA